MDGNRRFSRSRGLTIRNGHLLGAFALENVMGAAHAVGIEAITVYAFSIESFHRPKEQLMRFLRSGDIIDRRGIRVRVLGRLELLNDNIKEIIDIMQTCGSTVPEESNYQVNSLEKDENRSSPSSWEKLTLSSRWSPCPEGKNTSRFKLIQNTNYLYPVHAEHRNTLLEDQIAGYAMAPTVCTTPAFRWESLQAGRVAMEDRAWKLFGWAIKLITGARQSSDFTTVDGGQLHELILSYLGYRVTGA
ncbi:dehydrodolichyl diphosphate synthetase [Microsporum canis CBS 113480]|uniref:Dehydrodolichyl diphosphate synthetase n=1 Tax=Arthroderma otae (strain ATCC MYA-4605 / CBS 113480) TaxID=554155 RepID=C5FLA4_ARTOC|nr:dehydrodolichyl diphosphate synthetase [Microsporum canis CBS 113480]EEQ30476.1 dehydrodolichyl diphosphate synthetase [Microsporum canis CBS 113480]